MGGKPRVEPTSTELSTLVSELAALETRVRTLLAFTRQQLQKQLQAQLRKRRSDEAGERSQQLTLALTKHQGNVSAVAIEMDCARVQIRRWAKRYEINIDDFR